MSKTQYITPMPEDVAFGLVQQDYCMEEYADRAVELIRRAEDWHNNALAEKDPPPVVNQTSTPDRYVVREGSDLGHCCIQAHVLDLQRKPIHNPKAEGVVVAECTSMEDAKKVAAALNVVYVTTVDALKNVSASISLG